MAFVAEAAVEASASSQAKIDPKPAIAVIVADWGMQEKLHSALEPNLPPSYTLALHFMGKKTVATGQHALLVQIPTMQEFQQAETYSKSCDDSTRKRIQGIWVENHDGESPYPSSFPVKPYLVFSQVPLHPNPPRAGENTIVGHFWTPTSLPTSERQKVYAMALEYAGKTGVCVISITLATREAWDDFYQWAQSLGDKVQWIGLADCVRLLKQKAS